MPDYSTINLKMFNDYKSVGRYVFMADRPGIVFKDDGIMEVKTSHGYKIQYKSFIQDSDHTECPIVVAKIIEEGGDWDLFLAFLQMEFRLDYDGKRKLWTNLHISFEGKGYATTVLQLKKHMQVMRIVQRIAQHWEDSYIGTTRKWKLEV